VTIELTSLLNFLAFGWGVNIFEAIKSNDIVGFGCLLILGYLSIKTTSLVITKFREIKAATSETEYFMEDCFEGHKSLPEIYEIASAYPNSPLANLLCEAYIQYELEADQEGLDALPVEQRLQLSKTSVESVLERTISSELRRLDRKLISLATTSTLAPFIGLFGTVWGVLSAFQSLGTSGAADLSALAPGISTALVTTVCGLFVAIPAVGFYNYLSSHVSRLSSQMDSFAHELSNIFQKHLLRRV